MVIMKVFVAGSRSILKLNSLVTHRIDNIIEKNLKIIIGDANGADKAVQQYLKNKNYNNVEVFCMEGVSRNNIGSWPIRSIKPSKPNDKGFSYFSTKDRVMSEEADYGLMLWDSRSRGTLTNIIHLIRTGIPVVLYQGETCHNLFNLEQLKQIIPENFSAILNDKSIRSGGR